MAKDYCYIPNDINKKKTSTLIRKEVDVTIANLYKGDMEGLLSKHFGIPNKLIPYYITCNGFDCSSDYNGETNILLLADNILLEYL